MANIEKRKGKDGEISYRVKVRLKGHPTQSATFERLTDARRWESATESAIREGRHFKSTEAKRHTFAQLVDRYIKEVLPTKKASSVSKQTMQLNWWKDQLGAYTLADITPARITECRLKLESEPTKPKSADSEPRYRTPATVNRYLAALSHPFTIAMKEWNWIEDNPMRRVTKKKEPRGRVRFLSEFERESLLAACRESSNKDLSIAVILALSTGARQMEIMTLRWSQVDLSRRAITLYETKNDEIRVLPLVGHAHELMQKRAKVRRIDTDLVFPGAKEGKPVDLRSAWEFALKRANIENFRWHDLRHTCASYLAMNGATVAEIAEVLGHKTLQMVQRYAHLSQAHTSSVVEKMNKRVFG